MENLNIDIKKKIIDFLKRTKYGASSSEIAKNIGHNRITVTKYLEIMKAHKIVSYDDVAQAKLWHLNEKDSRKKILIVDDEPHITELIKFTLMDEKYILLEAFSGLDALDKVKKDTPDLIILDLMMPGINGYEVCQKLKQDALTQHIPILILSAKGELKDKIKGINVGADDYMVKPFDPADLQARVEQMLIFADKDLNINPLTNLPGKNRLIEVLQRIQKEKEMDIFKVEIEGMKIFNKKMGFRKGSEVIKLLSSLLVERLEKEGEIFHLINDIFVVITKNKSYKKDISKAFADVLPFMYNNEKPKDPVKLIISKIPQKSDISKIIIKIES